MVKKVRSFSTFPKIATIANSTSLKILKYPIFQNHIISKHSPHSSGWILVMQGFHGNLIVGLHGGFK
jgi:hypothetical protein